MDFPCRHCHLKPLQTVILRLSHQIGSCPWKVCIWPVYWQVYPMGGLFSVDVLPIFQVFRFSQGQSGELCPIWLNRHRTSFGTLVSLNTPQYSKVEPSGLSLSWRITEQFKRFAAKLYYINTFPTLLHYFINSRANLSTSTRGTRIIFSDGWTALIFFSWIYRRTVLLDIWSSQETSSMVNRIGSGISGSCNFISTFLSFGDKNECMCAKNVQEPDWPTEVVR